MADAKPKRSRLSAYFDQAGARAAARKRLPGWLLLLMPVVGFACVFGATAILVSVGLYVRALLYPDVPFNTARAPVLIFFGSFIGVIAPALMFGNAVLWLFPPIRNIFETNAKGVPGASFGAAMYGLVRPSYFTVPAGALIFLIGFAPF